MHRTLLAAAVTLAVVLPSSRAAAQVAAPDGAALYGQNCRLCHGLKGAAPQPMIAAFPTLPRSLADTAFLRVRSVDSIVAVIRHGAGRGMPSFLHRLAPEEIVAIARFVKSLRSDSTRAP